MSVQEKSTIMVDGNTKIVEFCTDTVILPDTVQNLIMKMLAWLTKIQHPVSREIRSAKTEWSNHEYNK